MKLRLLFLAFFVPLYIFSQLTENFSHPDLQFNNTWLGDVDQFVVNEAKQLQSCASSTSVSSVFTSSEVMIDASWECSIKIDYTTSSSNYAAVYIVSDSYDIAMGCYAYYVQIGGTQDEVSLFRQEGTKRTKIIDGIDKRTDGKPVEIDIKVTRDAVGNFELMSRLASETNYISEGKVFDDILKHSHYFGLLYSNTSTTGEAYYFDNIRVSGHKALDTESPEWIGVELVGTDELLLRFSEPMNFDQFSLMLNADEMDILIREIPADNKSILLKLAIHIEKGDLYALELRGLVDMANNALKNPIKDIGIAEEAELGDLLWNEIMFDHPLTSAEYVEVFNRSQKVIDLCGKIVTTRKADGTLNTGNKINEQTLIGPYAYMALTNAPDSVRNYHNCPDDAKIASLNLAALNNSSATLVLCNSSKDLIFDELTYSHKWHHLLVKEPKGVALEKIHPDMPTQDARSWYSASSFSYHGTPGYKNSQYKEFAHSHEGEKNVWIDPELFTPNNDGRDDLCFIHYNLPSHGYVANIAILNAVGVNVCKLINNTLLSTTGYVSWDGRTDQGNIATAGIYVLYFEIFNPTTGDKIIKKLPIVVSSI